MADEPRTAAQTPALDIPLAQRMRLPGGPMVPVPGAAFGPPPLPSDNWNHPIADDKWWQESVVFSFTDVANRLGCWLRLGMHPNQQVSNIYTWTGFGDELIDHRMLIDQPAPRDILQSSIGGATVRTIDPLRSYDIVIEQDDTRIEVVFSLYHHPVTTSYNVGAATVARGHYDGTGKAVGRLIYKGRETPINAVGFTDHSWGVRRKHLPASRVLWAIFDEDLYFLAIPVSTGETRTMIGYAYKDGVLGRLLTESTMGYSFREDWLTVSACNSRLVDDKGREFRLTGSTFGPSSTLPMGHGKFVTHASASFQCEGRQGGGILESAQFMGVPPTATALGLPEDSWWLKEV